MTKGVIRSQLVYEFIKSKLEKPDKLISQQKAIEIIQNEHLLSASQTSRMVGKINDLPSVEPVRNLHLYEIMDSHMYHNKLDAMRKEIAEEIESYRISDWETNNILADGLQMALNIIDGYREGELK